MRHSCLTMNDDITLDSVLLLMRTADEPLYCNVVAIIISLAKRGRLMCGIDAHPERMLGMMRRIILHDFGMGSVTGHRPQYIHRPMKDALDALAIPCDERSKAAATFAAARLTWEEDFDSLLTQLKPYVRTLVRHALCRPDPKSCACPHLNLHTSL